MNIMQHRSKKLPMLPLLLVAVAGLFLNTPNVMAAPVVSFNPGRIIDDIVFTASGSMNATQIQSFLNSKVPVCDTNGTQISEFGGGTRAQWGQTNYNQSTFVCLKDYTENGLTAAQIIYNTAQKYQINPQVLLVLLQKEQGLVTDTWPLNIQFQTATGYGCPDSSGCDTQYYGLTNQLDWSGKMFRAILNASPTWFTPYVIGNNFVRWSPTSSCGGSTVNIENRSTQALYNYTPYQPNQAALNAGYGSGDSCSSYGNRNFYLYFTDWFGSVRSSDTLASHPDGTLVNLDGRIYLIDGNSLHYIVNATVFESYNYRWQDVRPGTTGDRQLSISTPIDHINPSVLFRSTGTGVYSMVYENSVWVKRLLSYSSFVGLGYNWSQVRTIPASDMPIGTSSSINFSTRHSDGTLIGNQQGVFVIDTGTRRYVSPAVFDSHHWLWSDIVRESSADTALPIAANMTLSKGSVIADSSNLYIVSISNGTEVKRPIGPWYCYSNVFKYTTAEIITLSPLAVPQQTGALVTC